MARIIESNVIINIGVERVSNDDLKVVRRDIEDLAEALRKLKTIKPKIEFDLKQADVNRVKRFAEALNQIGGVNIAFGGKGNVGGIAGKDGTVGGLDPTKLQATATGLNAVNKELHKIEQLKSIGPKGSVLGLRGDLPGTASTSRATTIGYDEYGKERPGITPDASKSVEYEINGVLETRIELQHKINEAGEVQTRLLTTTVNMQKEVARQQARRSIQDELRGQDIGQNITDAQVRIKRWKGSGFKENIFKTRQKEEWVNGEKVVYSSLEFSKNLKNGWESVIQINEATNRTNKFLRENKELVAEEARLKRDEAKSQKEIATHAERVASLGEFRNAAEAEGFKPRGTRTTTDRKTGVETKHVQYWKSQRDGLGRYTIAVKEYNTATDKMITRNLEGAEAARFMGDSIFRAGEKVLQWTIATSVLFQAIRVMKELGREIIELESNTIFLARVADKLVSSYGIATDSFETKRAIAERLTSQIIKLTQAIGGNASEAQHAAATFLRAGQTEVEVIQSITAALYAARIAEMDIAEASKFLVSATLQFNLEASETLSVLDSLNTLSNNYKVTTEDLFASISRAGSVYAAHNGKIEELAATTAVLAEVTSRSGTQLGNALKTIQSRLDRVEVKKNLFKRLQISTADMTGKARSLNDMILELKIRMEGLSETEQNEITIQAAGVRQRAIMVSAINEADESIIAANKTLMDSGSAQEEYAEQVGTIGAALERLKGTFSAIAQSASGPIGGTIRVIVSLVDGILRVINAFDGLAIKMAGYITVFLILRRTVTLISTVVIPAFFTAIKIAGDYTAWFGMQAGFAGGKVNYLTGTLAAGTAGSRGFTAAISATALATGGWTIALGVAAFAISELVIASSTSAAATEGQTTAIDAQITAESKRRDAIVNTVNVVTRLAAEMHRLNLITAASGDPEGKNVERVKSLQKYINEIFKSAEMDETNLIGPDGMLDRDKLTKAREEGRRKSNESLKQEAIDLKRKQEVVQRKLDAAEVKKSSLWPMKVRDFSKPAGVWVDPKITLKNQEDYDAYARDARERAKALRRGAKAPGTKEGSPWGFGGNEVDHRLKEIARLESIDERYADEIAALNEVIALEKEIAAIKKDYIGLNIEILDEKALLRITELQHIASTETVALQDSLDELARSSEAEGLTGLSAPFEDTVDTLTEMKDRLIVAKNALEEWIDLHAAVGPEELEPYLKKLGEVNKELEKLFKHTAEIRKQRQSFATSQFKMRDQLADAFTVSKRGTAADQGLLSKAFGLSNVEEDIRTAKLRVFDVMKEMEVLAAKNRSGYASDALKDKSTGDALAKQVYLKEQLARLSELTLSKEVAILEAEKQIASERKKAADEAARALGLLSSTDKLRVLAQAQYFKNNPNRKISVEDAFMAPASGVKITEQFWNGRMQGFDPNGSGLERLLAGTEFGMTQEIVNSQERLTAAVDGATDASNRLDESLKLAVGYLSDSLVAGGQSAIVDVPKRSSVGYTGDVDQYTINIEKGAIDFSGLSTQFSSLIQTVVRDELDRAVANMRSRELPSAPTGIKPLQ